MVVGYSKKVIVYLKESRLIGKNGHVFEHGLRLFKIVVYLKKSNRPFRKLAVYLRRQSSTQEKGGLHQQARLHMYNINTKAHSCNRCCSKTAISITYLF